jgi:hypothetical protein
MLARHLGTMNLQVGAGERLILSLEDITTGSPSLSEEVLRLLGWRWEPFGCPGSGLWRTPVGAWHEGALPDVTESLDAARALVPDGLAVVVCEQSTGRWQAQLFVQPLEKEGHSQDSLTAGYAHTLPLALCSAMVKVRIIGITEGMERSL